MVETLTYSRKKISAVVVASLKGNTLGILNNLSSSDFEYAVQIKREPVTELQSMLEKSELILIGASTYSSKFQTEPEFPPHLRCRKELERLKGKDIILFGSGNSEYKLFCGALDYLEQMLKDNNNVLEKYKFEGYPKESQKEEFKKIVKGHMYENYKI